MRVKVSDLDPGQRAELEALMELPEDEIDTDDIPEVLEWRNPRRGLFAGSPSRKAESGPVSAAASVSRAARGRKGDGKRDESMIDWSDCPVVESVPDRLSGAWVFKGTRLPVYALFENLEAGATIYDFIEWFGGVDEAEVRAVLEHVAQDLRARAAHAHPVR